MKRYVLSTLVAAVLCALAGAQSGTAPHSKLLLLKQNRALYRSLVDGTVQMASKGTSNPLNRSQSFDPIIRELEIEIKEAARTGKTARVVELGKHLKSLMEKGLTPNLQKARKLISAGAPDEQELDKLLQLADRMSREVEESIKKSAMAGTSDVKDVLEGLRAARNQVEEAVKPPPTP